MKTLNIATACFVNENRELLVVRKQDTTTWMLPGGKLDDQETPAEALVREVWEELQIKLAANDLTPLGTFVAAAANEANTCVHAHAFIAQMPGNQQPVISAEIAQMQWLPLHEPLPETAASLLRHHIIPALSSL
tara:strand:+ start:202 stop:603 length:402 start_codon:yes stop_codon:yes gene_type:complete